MGDERHTTPWHVGYCPPRMPGYMQPQRPRWTDRRSVKALGLLAIIAAPCALFVAAMLVVAR